MAGRGESPEFVEALARGLDVITAFSEQRPALTLAEIAKAAGLARPTVRRLLLTLAELGFVRQSGTTFELTARVLDLGYAYVSSLGLWDLARPHLKELVRLTDESSSMAQLDGGDIVYVARVAVPKIIALRVEIGTRFPATVTSQGKVLLAALDPTERAAVLKEPSRSPVIVASRNRDELLRELDSVREKGWAVADEELAPGVRSIAAPVRDGEGVVRAAVNVTVHAAETRMDELVDRHLPPLLDAAKRISDDWARRGSRPRHDAAQREVTSNDRNRTAADSPTSKRAE